MARILLTGASGYVGGRLLRSLEEGGYALLFRGLLGRIAQRAVASGRLSAA